MADWSNSKDWSSEADWSSIGFDWASNGDWADNGDWLDVSLASAPAAPTGVSATALGPTSIQISWTDVADETGYYVERSADGLGGWTNVSGNLPADTVTWTDTGLDPETPYFYRVIAFNAEGDSDPSSTVNATTTAAGGCQCALPGRLLAYCGIECAA